MSGESELVSNTLAAGRFKSCAATHRGSVRAHNEDAYLNRPDLGLWAVADGAGGHLAGDVAARTVIEALDTIPADLTGTEALAQVRLRLVGAHTALREDAESRGPGSIVATTVVALVARNDHFACLWAGDSRAYLLREGTLLQITRDHSLVQELLDAGAITEAEAEDHPRANIITRAVGAEDDGLELDKVTGELRVGDRFMLCSDGLTKTLSDAEIAAVLASGEEEAAERLLLAALAHHAADNVTAVTVDVGGE
jgi:serine/threonine-protein phosphatase Stp1